MFVGATDDSRFRAANEENTDHLAEPDKRDGEVSFQLGRGWSRNLRALLDERSEQLE